MKTQKRMMRKSILSRIAMAARMWGSRKLRKNPRKKRKRSSRSRKHEKAKRRKLPLGPQARGAVRRIEMEDRRFVFQKHLLQVLITVKHKPWCIIEGWSKEGN